MDSPKFRNAADTISGEVKAADRQLDDPVTCILVVAGPSRRVDKHADGRRS